MKQTIYCLILADVTTSMFVLTEQIEDSLSLGHANMHIARRTDQKLCQQNDV